MISNRGKGSLSAVKLLVIGNFRCLPGEETGRAVQFGRDRREWGAGKRGEEEEKEMRSNGWRIRLSRSFLCCEGSLSTQCWAIFHTPHIPRPHPHPQVDA